VTLRTVSVVMKREGLGVGGVAGPLLEKREKWGTPSFV
jgi:hypothetical protein